MTSGDNRPGDDDRPLERPPRVFVSYTHDSERHKHHVLQFCSFLSVHGIDVHLDRWSVGPRRDWFAWAIQQMTKANFVIVVASAGFKKAGDGNAPATDHRGAQSEASILRELLHTNRETWLPKLLPVLLPGHTVDDIPLFLQPHTADHYRVTDFSPTGAEDLLRALTEQPAHPRPPTGLRPVLPPVTSNRHNTVPNNRPTPRNRLAALLTTAVLAGVIASGIWALLSNDTSQPTTHPDTTISPYSTPVPSGAAQTSVSSDQYVIVVQDMRLSLPNGRYCDQSQRIDLDSQKVGPEVDGADVWFFPCEPTVLQADVGAEAFAIGTAEHPTARRCVELARTQPSGPVVVETFEAGKTAFCVLTHKQAVGWLRYIGARDKNLTFELTLWRKL